MPFSLLTAFWHSRPRTPQPCAAVPAFLAQDRLREWAVTEKPVPATEIAPLLAQLQRDRGLSHPLARVENIQNQRGLSVPQTRAKSRLYQAAEEVGTAWWKLTRPLLEAKRTQLLRLAATGDFLDAFTLEDEVDRVLHAHVTDAFHAVPPERRNEYMELLHLKDHLTGDRSPRKAVGEHFSAAVRTGTSMNFTAARIAAGLPRAHLARGGLLPKACRGSAGSLFQEPFVREALVLPVYLATSHFGVSSAAAEVLGLSDVLKRLQRQPEGTSAWQLVLRGDDRLHLALSPQGAQHVGRALSRSVDTLMEGDRAARLGCPAMRILDQDPLHPDTRAHVLEYLKKTTLELAQAHVFSAEALQLKGLHAQATAAQ